MFRSIPPVVLSKKEFQQTQSKLQENNNTGARSQQSCFVTLLRSHPCTDKPLRICSISTEQPLRENTSGGLALQLKRILKDLNYKKLLFTVAKRNLLTLRMNKVNK